MKSSAPSITLREAISEYQSTLHYRSLRPATKANSEKSFLKLTHLMERPANSLTQSEMLGIMNAQRPGMAYVFATRVGAMLRHTLLMGHMNDNPLRGFKLPASGEYRPWTKGELKSFLRRTRVPAVRLAIQLAYYTGQRMGDVVSIEWSDVKADGSIHIVQQKTGNEVFAPISPALRRLLDAIPRTGATIVAREDGSSYTVPTFRTAFRRERVRLRFPNDLHFHGIRKLVACELAEGGASTEEIKAVGGWKTSRQVDHYTKAVRRRAMAENVVEMLEID